MVFFSLVYDVHIYMYACLHVWVHMCVWACVHMHACGGWSRTLDVSLIEYLPLYTKAGLVSPGDHQLRLPSLPNLYGDLETPTPGPVLGSEWFPIEPSPLPFVECLLFHLLRTIVCFSPCVDLIVPVLG